MAGGRVQRVAVRGCALEVEEWGEPGGRPFVLVHGYTGSRDDWLEQLPRLAGLGHVIAVDQLGHGGSDNPGDPARYRLDSLALDLRALLDALHVDRCDLLGHSMGGMMALRHVLAEPERTASLVLMDTTPRALERMPEALRKGALATIEAGGMKALFEVMRAGARRDERRPAAARRCEERMGSERFWDRISVKLSQMDPVAFDRLGADMGSDWDLVPRLGEIGCPTLVLVGEQDAPFLGPSEEMATGIPNARLARIEDAAHSPQLENPDAWYAAIEEHLRGARDPAA